MYGLNRTLCDVLEDMRRILKTGVLPADTLLSLVEEAQCMGNRMEAGLGDINDRERLLADIKKLKAKRKKLKEQVEPPKEDDDDLFSFWDNATLT